MKFYRQSVVQKVRRLRTSGLSIRSIAIQANIPSSTVSRWVKDLPGQDKNFNKAHSVVELELGRFIAIAADMVITEQMAKICASLLYWCEGSKYPSSNFLAFTNSDWTMSETFLRLLRTGFTIDNSKLRAHLQVHSSHSYTELLSFWSKLLGIPKSQFYKPTITHPTSRMKRLEYKGTCTIKYFDTRVLHNITGIYTQFARTHGRVA